MEIPEGEQILLNLIVSKEIGKRRMATNEYFECCVEVLELLTANGTYHHTVYTVHIYLYTNNVALSEHTAQRNKK